MQHTDALELNACIRFLRRDVIVKSNGGGAVASPWDMTNTFSDSRDARINELFASSPPNDDGAAALAAWTATPLEIKQDVQRRQKEREMDEMRAAARLQQQPQPAVAASPKPPTTAAAATQQQQQPLSFQRRAVKPRAAAAAQSALTADLQRAKKGGAVVTGNAAAATANGPSVKLTIYLPSVPPRALELRVSKTARVEDAIAAVLQRALIAGRRRKNVRAFEMRMHDEDGQPDEDFPALDLGQNIADIGCDEFCLVDLGGDDDDADEEEDDEEEATPAAPPPSSQRKQSLSKAGVIHVQFVDIDHHDQRGSSQKVDASDTRASHFLKKVVKAVQLPLVVDEYQFHVTEPDRERLHMVSSVVHVNDDVLALGVEVLLLRKRRYADAPPDVEAVLGLTSQRGGGESPLGDRTPLAPAAAAAAGPPPAQPHHAVLPLYKLSSIKPPANAAAAGAAAIRKQTALASTGSGLLSIGGAAAAAPPPATTSAAGPPLHKQSMAQQAASTAAFAGGVDPNTILLNEIKAAVYEEWRVTKTNNWGKRQNRVLGIDLTKIYNKPQSSSSSSAAATAAAAAPPSSSTTTTTSAATATASTGKVKNPERLIADVVSIELSHSNAAAFTIKVRDTGGISGAGLVTLNYEAEGGADDAARIVAKVKYIMGGRAGKH